MEAAAGEVAVTVDLTEVAMAGGGCRAAPSKCFFNAWEAQRIGVALFQPPTRSTLSPFHSPLSPFCPLGSHF